MWRTTCACLLVLAADLSAGEVPVLPPEALRPLPPRTPEESLASFALDPAFRIELVAAEPLIASPVALSFDENGALFVCEMRDYSERREEKLGRVSRLEDRDGDGRMDHATRFAEGLPWPTGVLCFDGGVLVMAAPDLWFFKDTDGDGVADERRVVLTGFSELATRLNVQQLPNSLRWGPDQRVHLAEGGNGSRVRPPEAPPAPGLVLRGRDLSFDPRTMDLRAESGGGQYGLAFDDAGRKFVCSNSRHLIQIAYDMNLLGDSPGAFPAAAVDIAADGPAAPVFRRSPDEAWRVIRTRWRVSGVSPGLIEGGGTPSGYFTGATGLQIARGDRMRAPLTAGDESSEVFIADTGSNLVHRKHLRPDGVLLKGERPDPHERREFLASTDNWFRPVQIENGPSGGLYIVDFCREIIEHPWSLPPGIKEHLDLNRGNDRGRIWRIVSTNSPSHRAVKLGDATAPELVTLLGHANGWHRDTAARLLWERNQPEVTPLLVAVTRSASAHGRMGALSLLRARGELDATVLEAALADPAPAVRLRALHASVGLPWFNWSASPWRELAEGLARDPEAEVCFTFALCVSGTAPDAGLVRRLWPSLFTRAGNNRWLQAASLRLVAPVAREVHEALNADAMPGVGIEFQANIAALAVRAAGLEVTKQWLTAAGRNVADGDRAPVRLLSLAAGTARVPELARELQLPAETSATICTTALTVLRSIHGSANPDDFAWLADALTLAEQASFRSILLPALPTLPSAAARDLLAEALVRRNDRELAAALLTTWSALSPRVRNQMLESALRDAARLGDLLGAAGRDAAFREQLGPAFRNAAREHRDADIRETALRLFGPMTSVNVEERRRHFVPTLTTSGDAVRGRLIYQIRCASCHRAAGEGFTVGPDLLTVAAAGRESLLTGLLEPQREVAPRFEAWVAKLTGGEEVTGLLTEERPDGITLRSGGGMERRLARASVVSLASTGRSLMPDGLDEGLSPGEMADLLRFIESLVESSR